MAGFGLPTCRGQSSMSIYHQTVEYFIHFASIYFPGKLGCLIGCSEVFGICTYVSFSTSTAYRASVFPIHFTTRNWSCPV